MMNEEPVVVSDEMMTTQVVNEEAALIASPEVPEDVMTIASIEEPTPISTVVVEEPAQAKVVTQYVAFVLVAVVFVAGVSLFLTARRVKNEKA